MLVQATFISVIALLRTAHTFALPANSPVKYQAKGPISSLPPSQDPFYKVPLNVASFPQGHIIRARKLPDTTSLFGINAGDTYQLLFRTNSVHMKPDASVTTVIVPKIPAKGPPKIIAIASPEDSPAIDCALSWALYPGVFEIFSYPLAILLIPSRFQTIFQLPLQRRPSVVLHSPK